MFDLIITPVTNKFTLVMKLYDKLRHQLSDNTQDTMTFINNGSEDGLSPASFHSHNRIRYVGSNKKIYENILVNHAIIEREDINDYVVFLQPNVQIPVDYFSSIRQVITDNPEVDVFLGRVDNKLKKTLKIVKDPRSKKFNDWVKSNSGAVLKNPPPVPEKTHKIDEKATDISILTLLSKNKTETEIPAQNISADFSSRLEEPSDAQFAKGAESILSAQVEKAKIPQESAGDKKRQGSLVTDFVSDKKCQAIFSDKICQCKLCVENDTIKSFNINLFNISKFYVPNNVIIKKECLYKMGLLEIDSVFNSACENLIYKLKNLQDAYITYDESFPVTSLGKVKKHRSNNTAINNIINFDFIYKDYITKNVYSVVKTATPETPYRQVAIRALIIVATTNNIELLNLVKEQVSEVDRLVVTDLPDNCSKKLQEIIAKNTVDGQSWDCVIIVNPNAKFRYGHFIDDFKRYAVQMDEFGVLVSSRDFDMREISVGHGVESDSSACFNKWNVFSPELRRATSLSNFFERCSDVIDKTDRGLVKEYLPKPVSKDAFLVAEIGEGGQPVAPSGKHGKQHDSSWYNWME